MAIGNRIRSRREELGLTQQELAERLGYKSKSSINKVEMGINDVTQKKIPLYAKALETSIEYLMGMEGGKEIAQHKYYTDPETAQIAQKIFDDPELHALFDAARDSKPENLKAAAAMLKALKGTNLDG